MARKAVSLRRPFGDQARAVIRPGIDVSKNTFDTNLGAGTKARSKSFANSPAGWHQLIAWARRTQDRTGSRLSGGNCDPRFPWRTTFRQG